MNLIMSETRKKVLLKAIGTGAFVSGVGLCFAITGLCLLVFHKELEEDSNSSGDPTVAGVICLVVGAPTLLLSFGLARSIYQEGMKKIGTVKEKELQQTTPYTATPGSFIPQSSMPDYSSQPLLSGDGSAPPNYSLLDNPSSYESTYQIE